LRVISHHRARLATPIRTVQKIYGDADIENIPYGETIYSRNPSSRPFLLIEPQTRVHTEEKHKAQNRQPSDQKPTAHPDVTIANNSDSNKHQVEKVAATPAAAEGASENALVEGNKGKAEKVQTNPEQVKRPSFEDNIVLGVALEGSKRTLPIEEGMSTSSETNEMDKVGPAPSAKDKKGQIPAGQGKVDPEGSR
jgi:mechanosensitive ion channel protein 1/2/3